MRWRDAVECVYCCVCCGLYWNLLWEQKETQSPHRLLLTNGHLWTSLNLTRVSSTNFAFMAYRWLTGERTLGRLPNFGLAAHSLLIRECETEKDEPCITGFRWFLKNLQWRFFGSQTSKQFKQFMLLMFIPQSFEISENAHSEDLNFKFSTIQTIQTIQTDLYCKIRLILIFPVPFKRFSQFGATKVPYASWGTQLKFGAYGPDWTSTFKLNFKFETFKVWKAKSSFCSDGIPKISLSVW